MITRWVPPIRTPAPALVVSRAYAETLRKRVPASDMAVAILHAHGALETGHFRECWNGNAGNIKAGMLWKGRYTTIKLNEVLKRNGTRVTVWFSPFGELTSKNGTIVPGTESMNPPGHLQTRMRAYESLADGIEDKVDFLFDPRWRPALDDVLAGNPAGYVEKIHVRGYFTAPLEPYRRAVVSLAKTLLPLAAQTSDEPATLPPDEDRQLCLDMATCHRFELPQWLRDRVNQDLAATAAQMREDNREAETAARDALVREP